VSDYFPINETLAKLLETIKNVLDTNLDLNQSLFFINNIIRDLQTSNRVQRLSSDSSKSTAKLIDNNVDLLNVNESCIVKTKERSAKTKNRKNTITQTKKTKIKSIKRDFFDFEHVDAAIKVSRNNKDAIERDNNCDKTRQRKQKKSEVSIVAAINANIRTFNKNINEIHEDIRDIIIRQTIRKTTKKAMIIFAVSAISAIIRATIKKIILINDDNEFDADDGGDADSDDD
jgi:hypothetical protein